MSAHIHKRDNSRYRRPGPIDDRSYEINVESSRVYWGVPKNDLSLLGLLPDWNPMAFLSVDCRRSWAGEVVYLPEKDVDVFCDIYTRCVGHAPLSHVKGNGARCLVSRLPFLSEPIVGRRDPDLPCASPYPCSENQSECRDVTVWNPILQSVTDFVMYVMVHDLVDNHPVQGPRMLETSLRLLKVWVRSKTPKLSGTFYDDKTRLMWVYSLRTDFPVCPTCGRKFGAMKNIHLSKTYVAYQPHCSSSCARRDPYVIASYRTSCMARYGVSHPLKSEEVKETVKQTLLRKYGTTGIMHIKEIKEKAKATNRKRYGVDYPAQNPSVMDKVRDTTFKRYGVTNSMRSPEVRAKARATLLERYGTDNPMLNRDVLAKARATRFARQRKGSCIPVDGGYLDHTSWEKKVYDLCVKHGLKFKYHPMLLDFEFQGKVRHYEPDFEIEGRLYECKGDQFIREDGRWQSVYDHSMDELYEAKHQCAIRHNVRILTAFDMPYVEDIILHPERDCVDNQGYSANRAYKMPDVSEHSCFGLTDDQIVSMCVKAEFPGTWSWSADHPIWDCNTRGSISPREAWSRPSYLMKAVANMFYMINREVYGVRRDTRFIDAHRKAFEKAVAGDPSDLYVKVLNRFTIARIAPKVTALPPALFRRIVSESGLDISRGIYCPMAGFGGIVLGTKQWFKQRGMDWRDKIYAADINPSLCKRYGWECKDVLSDHVTTDRIVAACPPFSDTEQWPGTPAENYRDFHEWARLIREHIKAPGYILIGPSERYVRNKDKHGRTLSPLFAHKEQARYHPEYSQGVV